MIRILVTHTDLDGAGCYVVFSVYYADESGNITVICSGIEKIDENIRKIIDSEDFDKDNTEIIIADICPTKSMLTEMIERGINFRIFDHHASSKWATQMTDKAVITSENNQSGTSLLYQYLCTCDNGQSFGSIPGLDEFVDTVRSYDTYEWKQTNNIKAKDLCILFFLLGMNRFTDEYIKRYSSSGSIHVYETDLIYPGHQPYIDSKKEQTQAIIDATTPDRIMTIMVNDRKVAVMFFMDGMDTSELSYQFLIKYTEYDVFLTINMGGKNIQYRTQSDIDLTEEFAIPMGGGGHPKAAGSPIPKEDISLIMYFILRKLLPGLTRDPRMQFIDTNNMLLKDDK